VEEIDAEMERIGFQKVVYKGFESYNYENELIRLSDIHEGNVLKTENGNFRFIDTIPAYRDSSMYFDFKIISPAIRYNS
jgi:hypothetical protein